MEKEAHFIREGRLMVFFDQDRWLADNGDYTKRLDYSLNSDSVVVDLGGYRVILPIISTVNLIVMFMYLNLSKNFMM